MVQTLTPTSDLSVGTWTTSGVPGTFTTVTQTLTAGEANAITNYAALSLRFVADEA